MRPSMLTLQQRALWLTTADCPRCGAENHDATRPITMSGDGAAHCDKCGEHWTPEMPRQEVIHGR